MSDKFGVLMKNILVRVLTLSLTAGSYCQATEGRA